MWLVYVQLTPAIPLLSQLLLALAVYCRHAASILPSYQRWPVAAFISNPAAFFTAA